MVSRGLINFFLFSLCRTQSMPCSRLLSIDISNGTKIGQTIHMNGVDYTKSNYFEDNGKIRGCICNIKTCIRKCCYGDDKLDRPEMGCEEESNIYFTFHNGTNLDLNVPSRDYFVLTGSDCPLDEYEFTIHTDNYTVHENGYLNSSNEIYTTEQYCLMNDIALVCTSIVEVVDDTKYSTMQSLNAIGMLISIPFLLMTFIVYLIMPEKNLHRKALMSYVIALLIAYVNVIVIYYSGYITKTTCHILGYMIIFFFMVSFFWMNVMCIDMWLAFSDTRTTISRKMAKGKKFTTYCIYAWGVPIIHVLMVFFLNNYGDENAEYHPKIGNDRCFLNNGLPTFYYFYLPMAILLAINLGLFINTVIIIHRMKKETSMLKRTDSKKHSYESDKKKFNLYLKLIFAMGINWIMDLVSWLVDWKVEEVPIYVWYITDCINVLYGVFIFLIFACKKNIWKSVEREFCIVIGKKHRALSTTTSSARPARSSCSTVDATANADYSQQELGIEKNSKELSPFIIKSDSLS